MAHTNGSEQRNGYTHDAAQLRHLREKFEAGTASAQETLSWLDHLLEAAQQRGDQEWIPVLYRLREAQATAFARGPETTLRDPADPQQYLAWISPTQIRPSSLYEDEPVDDVTLTALVESIQQEGGIHDPLFVSTDHEIIHGRTRWLAWQRAGLDAHRRVPVLVKPLSAAQKKRAFLSTKVVGQRTALLRATTAARQYAAALAAMPVASASDTPTVASPGSPSAEHAVTLPTLVARIAVLPDSERRLLTRQLVAEDAMLQDTLLAEAERHVGSSDEKRRLTAELQQLRRTLEEISTEQDRRQHTVDQSGRATGPGARTTGRTRQRGRRIAARQTGTGAGPQGDRRRGADPAHPRPAVGAAGTTRRGRESERGHPPHSRPHRSHREKTLPDALPLPAAIERPNGGHRVGAHA